MNFIKRFVLRSALASADSSELTRLFRKKGITGLSFHTDVGEILIPSNSRSIIDEFLKGKYFGETVLQRFLQLAPRSRRLINVGANVGTSARYINFYNAYDQIDCFEPDPNNFRFLTMNTSLCDRINLHNEAVGSQPGRLALFQNHNSVGRHSFKTDFGMGSIEVPVRSIEQLVDESEQFDLFVDVEGWEIEVIRGASSSLRRCGIFAVEWNGQLYSGEDCHAAVDILTDAGFVKAIELGRAKTYSLTELPSLLDQVDIAFVR